MTRARLEHEGVGLLLGYLLGAVLGVIGVSLAPLLVILMPVLAVVVSVTGLREIPADTQRSAGGAGLLLGLGTVFTYGVANTFLACEGTDDFCGNANIVPLIALAGFTLACGVVLIVISIGRSRA